MNPFVATGVGVFAGTLLVVVGYLAGRFMAGRGGVAELAAGERERLAGLVRDLEQWTHRYSGDVSQYQKKLVGIRDSLPGDATPGENRFVLMLSEIMRTNTALQERLENAERQLERQTAQIESYLSEARTDGLTGMANRRSFDRELDQMFNAYRGGGRSFVLALFDIDHFKSVNDTHGHQAGDQVLRDVALAVRRGLPDADLTARFGGEEFAVLMSTPIAAAARSLDDVRREIGRTPINVGGIDIRPTVSIGVAETRDDAVVSGLLRRADEALYAAKNTGRDRVYLHTGGQPTLLGAPESLEI